MTDLEKEIVRAIKSAIIDCPDCDHIGGDDYDQYTCTTCWYQGGGGKINVFEYIKEHRQILDH